MLDADMILTALGAGATAGMTTTGAHMITDAYAELKSVIRRKLTAGGQPDDIIDGVVETARARQVLNDAGIPSDPEVIAAYRQVVALLEESTTFTVINSETVNGAAGTFKAPVTIHNAPPVGQEAADPR
ncbi:hypothetical protein [Streptomyces sp. NPDC005476]|uniref:hypothetical protein n=1 Tax=Streptomyces sp. NPDC005476 TaxID=3156882 RepID=UPI00345542C2